MLFGLFFGAGNLIFPVHMGQMAGKNVWLASIGLCVTGVGLPLLGVAALGISRNRGAKNKASKNNTPVTSEVNPERPPSAIPEALSSLVVIVELPIMDPTVVPIASDIIASFTWGICPSSSIRDFATINRIMYNPSDKSSIK